MKDSTKSLALLAAALFPMTGYCADVAPTARMEVMEIPGSQLQGNPLHDPVKRNIAAFFPAQSNSLRSLPVVYYLPGYGGSSVEFINARQTWIDFVQRVSDQIAPFILVVVDARTRWGGSQYLNSSAQGNYAAYICDEIVPLFEQAHHLQLAASERIVAGHSSGGFGALRLGMMQRKLFGAVIALSPDSDFPTTHLPLVDTASARSVSPAEIEKIVATPDVSNGSAKLDRYLICLSAAYAPASPGHPGRFEWLYDDKGAFQPKVWERWLANDPLTLVREHQDAFASEQRVYLDGSAQDDFKANIGARKIFEVLSARHADCDFYEPPGHHSDHMQERLERGLAWVFGKPTVNIQ